MEKEKEKEYSILDAYLLENSYIVLFSGLATSPIDNVVKELNLSFDGIVLDYMHLDMESDLTVINERVTKLIKEKKQVFFIKGKSFNSKKIKIPINLHIHINEQQVGDVELSSKYRQLLKETNYIHKKFNFNTDTDINKNIDDIFNYIVDDIEKKLYKDNYERLSHKYYTETNTERPESHYNSTLMYDKGSMDKKQWEEKALKQVNDEYNEDLENEDDTDKDDTDEDMLHDSIRVK